MRYARYLMIAAIALLGLLAAAACFRYPGLLIIAGIAACSWARRRVHVLASHGTAAWANLEDLRKAGMLGGEGLPIGRIHKPRSFWGSLNGLFDRRIPAYDACLAFMLSMRKLQRLPPATDVVTLNRTSHISVYAPTGVGKGVSLVIPFLFRCRDSCVVVDFKGENAEITAAARRAMGQKTVILDPFGVAGGRDTFNPLGMILRNSPLLIDECKSLANALVIRTGEEKDP